MTAVHGGPGICDWRTPAHILGFVRDVFDREIDLDPATNEDNPTYAHAIFTRDGLEKRWVADTIFMNPPWSRKLKLPIEPWLVKLREADAREKIAIIPASVGTGWFHRQVWDRFWIVCFPKGRVKYDPPPGIKGTSPSFDSCLVYHGRHCRESFIHHGMEIGHVVRP